ncbi:carboxypeptidase-like regulatory domain-containing protein [Geotalea toluenoxydans]|uniref:carboxypeptidase-like regulatory domain-containing protein n=1 Tax=Geotalea toluenoxydans TaxID=421624 RepID=UPI0006D20B6C|nr:carboxypeptidase-like regulatory domain-containing protein [Geotalea toluenoxydans]
MAGITKTLICSVAFLFTTATSSFAYGTINGRLQMEKEPLRCAAFAYTTDKAPTSSYSAPFFAVPCGADGAFSMMLPPGTYLIASGISIGNSHIFATQPDPKRRLPIEGPHAQIITVTDNSTHTLSRSNDRSDFPFHESSPTVNQSQNAGLATVTGTVRDQAGNPVSLAVVNLLAPDQPRGGRNKVYISTPTDAKGEYAIEMVKPQTYLLQAFRSDPLLGYMTSPAAPVDLSSPHNPLRYHISLSPPRPSAPAPQEHQPPPLPAATGKPQRAPITAPLTDPASM